MDNVFQKAAAEMVVKEERTIKMEAIAEDFPARVCSKGDDTPLDAINACEAAGLSRQGFTDTGDWVVRKER